MQTIVAQQNLTISKNVIIQFMIIVTIFVALFFIPNVAAQTCDYSFTQNTTTQYVYFNGYGNGSSDMTLCGEAGDRIYIDYNNWRIYSPGGENLTGFMASGPAEVTLRTTGIYRIQVLYTFEEYSEYQVEVEVMGPDGWYNTYETEYGYVASSGAGSFNITLRNTRASWSTSSSNSNTTGSSTTETRSSSSTTSSNNNSDNSFSFISLMFLVAIIGAGGGIFYYFRKGKLATMSASSNISLPIDVAAIRDKALELKTPVQAILMRVQQSRIGKLKDEDTVEKSRQSKRLRAMLYRTIALTIVLVTSIFVIISILLDRRGGFFCSQYSSRDQSCVEYWITEPVFYILTSVIILIMTYLLNQFVIQPTLDHQSNEGFWKRGFRAIFFGIIIGGIVAIFCRLLIFKELELAFLFSFPIFTTFMSLTLMISAASGTSNRGRFFKGLLWNMLFILFINLVFIGIILMADDNSTLDSDSIFPIIMFVAIPLAISQVFSIPTWFGEWLASRP